MAFMDLGPPRPPRRWVDHLTILAAVVVSLAAFRLADDDVTGTPDFADAIGGTLLFFALGAFLARRPEADAWARRMGLGPFVTPAFIGLTLAYFYLGLRSDFIQPGATGPLILTQVLALVVLSCRAASIGA